MSGALTINFPLLCSALLCSARPRNGGGAPAGGASAAAIRAVDARAGRQRPRKRAHRRVRLRRRPLGLPHGAHRARHMQPWHADAVVVRHPRHAHHLQIRAGRGGRAESRGGRARHDRPGDIRRHEAGGRVRLRAQPGRRAEHRERAAVSQDAGRLRGLQRLPPVRRLLRVQGHGRGQEDAGAVGARASGLVGPDRGRQRRGQVPAGTARHELRVQGVRRARPRAGALRAPLLRAVGRQRWRRPREKKRGPWRPEEQAFLRLRVWLPLLLPVLRLLTRRESPARQSAGRDAN